MSYPGDPYGDSRADPAAIDQILIAAKQGVYDSEDIPILIAAVEALRERVEELIERNAVISRRCTRHAIAMTEANECAEAADAHADELWEALDTLRPFFEGEHSYDHPDCIKLRAGLAATPPEALARARARDDATAALRFYYFAEMMHASVPSAGKALALGEIGLFLGKLDAFQPTKEKKL